MNKEMQATPLSYMDVMQKHAHSVAELDRLVSAIHGGVGGDANLKGNAKIQRQFQLLPVAVKAAKKASVAYDKATSKFTDVQLKTLYEVPAAKRGGQVPHTPMSGGRARARSPMVEPSRARSLSPGARPARAARSRTRSPGPSPEPFGDLGDPFFGAADLTDDEKEQKAPPSAAVVHAMGGRGAPPRSNPPARPGPPPPARPPPARPARGRRGAGRAGRGGRGRGRGAGRAAPPRRALPAVAPAGRGRGRGRGTKGHVCECQRDALRATAAVHRRTTPKERLKV